MIAAACAHASVAAPDSIRLRYGLRPGSTYDQAMSFTLTLQMEAEGLPAEASVMLQALGRDMKQDLHASSVIEVGRREADGSVPIEARVIEARASMTLSGQPIEIPGLAERLTGRTMRGRLGADGRSIEMRIEDLGELPRDLAGRMGEAMPVLPDGEMKVGESFEVPADVSLPWLPVGGGIEVRSLTVYTLRSIGEKEAILDVRQRLLVGAGDERSGEGILSVAGESAGTAVFDLREGVFSSLRMQMKVDAETSVPAPLPVEEGAAVPARVKIAIRGPLEVTTTRRKADG